jgi:hypothetical protein
MKQLTIQVTPELFESIRIYAYATDMSINDAIIHATSEFLSNEGKEEQVMAFLSKARSQYRVALDKLAEL